MMAIPHIGFILAAYGFTAVVLGGTVLALMVDRHRQKRLLARFEQSAQMGNRR